MIIADLVGSRDCSANCANPDPQQLHGDPGGEGCRLRTLQPSSCSPALPQSCCFCPFCPGPKHRAHSALPAVPCRTWVPSWLRSLLLLSLLHPWAPGRQELEAAPLAQGPLPWVALTPGNALTPLHPLSRSHPRARRVTRVRAARRGMLQSPWLAHRHISPAGKCTWGGHSVKPPLSDEAPGNLTLTATSKAFPSHPLLASISLPVFPLTFFTQELFGYRDEGRAHSIPTAPRRAAEEVPVAAAGAGWARLRSHMGLSFISPAPASRLMTFV